MRTTSFIIDQQILELKKNDLKINKHKFIVEELIIYGNEEK